MALPQKLKSPKDSIRQVFNTVGLKAWRFNHFWRIYQIPSNNQSAKFATIIAKKHIPLSTQRNLIERIIHAWILNHHHEFPENYDYVFVWSFSVKKQLEKIVTSQETINNQHFDLSKIKETFPTIWNQKTFKNPEVLSIYRQLLKQTVKKSFLWKTFEFKIFTL